MNNKWVEWNTINIQIDSAHLEKLSDDSFTNCLCGKKFASYFLLLI